MRVTIHHCFFDGTRQRHPRVRFAKVHLYNNYTRNWGIYAVCASVESQVFILLAMIFVFFSFHSTGCLFFFVTQFIYSCQIYSQCNIYEAGQKKVAFRYLSEKVKLYIRLTNYIVINIIAYFKSHYESMIGHLTAVVSSNLPALFLLRIKGSKIFVISLFISISQEKLLVFF